MKLTPLIPLLCAMAAQAAPLPIANVARKAPVDFPADIYPILKSNCIACHNKTTTKGGLNMETPELMKKGGENGTAIVPGKAADSLLLQSAAHQGDSDMPPKGNKVGAVNLTPEELGLIKMWIDQGAKPGKKLVQQIAWQPLPPGLNPIYAVAMSPAGEFVACSRANQVFLYDLATRQQVAQFVTHRDMNLALAFSPDGARLASGSFGEVKVWKRDAAKLPVSAAIKPILDAEARVQQGTRAVALAGLDVAFQNTSIAAATAEVTAAKDRVKKATDAIADTKKKLDEKTKAVKPAIDAKVAAQKALTDVDALVAAAPKDKPDAALTKKQADAKTKLEASTKAETDANEALKAAQAAAANATEELPKVTKLQADAEKAVVDAKAVLVSMQATQKKATDDLAASTKLQADVIKAAPTLALSPDHRWLIEPQADGSSLIWAVGAALPVAKFVPRAAPVAAVPPPAATPSAAAVPAAPAAAVIPAPVVAAAPPAAAVKPATAVAAAVKPAPVAAPAPAKPVLTWKPDNQLAIPADSGTLSIQDLMPKWVLERTLGTGDAASIITDRVNALSFSPDGKTIAVGSGVPSRGGDITLWDANTGKLTQAIRDRHSDAVLSLDFSPDGKLIASGGADKQLRVSEVVSGKQLKVFEGHTHHVLGVSWRADGRVLASSGADFAVKVWDWIKGERRKSLDGWDKEVTSLHYLGTSSRLLTTSGDKQVRLIGEDASAPAALPGTTEFMQTASASRDGAYVAAGGEDSVLRIWDAKTAKEIVTFAKP